MLKAVIPKLGWSEKLWVSIFNGRWPSTTKNQPSSLTRYLRFLPYFSRLAPNNPNVCHTF